MGGIAYVYDWQERSYDPPECHPGQQAYTFLIRILLTSFISVSIFFVCCYSRVSISMVHTLTQGKARFRIVAVIVYSWCCSYGFISLLMYSWIEYYIYGQLSFLSRDLLNPPAASVNCLYSDFTAYKWHSEHQRESRGTLEVCPCMPFIFGWWSCEECKF